jgi:hypothetical protein
MEIKIFGTIAPMLINFILLFNRKKKWALSKYRWYFVLSLSILGVFIYILTNNESLYGRTKLAIWGLLTPLIFSLMDVAFRNYSKQLHNRDLYLWLRGSNDIDDSKLSGGKHVKGSDRILSMILLFTVIFLPLIIIVFK